TPLAAVRGANNAISVVGDMVGRVFYQGLGAGRLPTASAVVADLIDTAVGRAALTFRTLELWSQGSARAEMADYSQSEGRFYLRLTVEDHPGVLAEIAGILGRHDISIASVIQRELAADRETDEAAAPAQPEDVMLVIMTHSAQEGRAAAAQLEIDKLPSVRPGSVRMRVLD
ncbi:MAG: ACT domain-containing protein, partial [Planctomycetales bacterium]|nr:ACT domain-containing protein [Planctomycetales bacterium]